MTGVQTCALPILAVDGGKLYLRRAGDMDCYTEISITEEYEREESEWEIKQRERRSEYKLFDWDQKS